MYVLPCHENGTLSYLFALGRLGIDRLVKYTLQVPFICNQLYYRVMKKVCSGNTLHTFTIFLFLWTQSAEWRLFGKPAVCNILILFRLTLFALPNTVHLFVYTHSPLSLFVHLFAYLHFENWELQKWLFIHLGKNLYQSRCRYNIQWVPAKLAAT